jgi:hypothetical protein
LRVFENRVLRRIFGPKREEVTGGWRRLHNEELHNLHASLNIVKVMTRRVVNVTGMGEVRNAYKILIGKPDVKRPLVRPRLRWKDNIITNLREIGLENVDDASGSG